jgi:tetratricopeptide (TPR) repeat protein
MKYCCSLAIILLLNTAAFAQGDAKTLTKEGIDLNNQKNYAAAITKYKAALAADTSYAPANYQLAFTLNASGKGLDGIPYLQKVFVSPTASANLIGGAYDLAGSIYDQNHLPKKAIENYLAGIKANPTYQPLRYDLGLAYFRNKQYADAEQAAIEALKLDPKHAGSMRLYALVTFHQNKRAEALLGFCSFILTERNTARSAEAYGNIQHILQGGALKPEPGVVISPETKAMANAENLIITKSLADFATRRYTNAGDLLAAQLKGVFVALGNMPRDKPRYWYAMSDYFARLAASPNTPAFARLISQTTPESAKWIKDHAQQMADLDAWISGTERGF